MTPTELRRAAELLRLPFRWYGRPPAEAESWLLEGHTLALKLEMEAEEREEHGRFLP